MVVGIVGSRTITSKYWLLKAIKELGIEITTVVSGGAKGVDTIAEKYADENKLNKIIIKPEWDNYGKRAGYLRNIEIFNTSEFIIIIWDSVSSGTKHMIDMCKKNNKPHFLMKLENKWEYFFKDYTEYVEVFGDTTRIIDGLYIFFLGNSPCMNMVDILKFLNMDIYVFQMVMKKTYETNILKSDRKKSKQYYIFKDPNSFYYINIKTIIEICSYVKTRRSKILTNILEKISSEYNDEYIFVFGSNENGMHGKGAAKHARRHYGAEYGIGIGICGHSYAIPTKDEFVKKPLSLIEITNYVNGFLKYASENQDKKFLLTRIGCGLSGYKDSEILPLFGNVHEYKNIILNKTWNKKND